MLLKYLRRLDGLIQIPVDFLYLFVSFEWCFKLCLCNIYGLVLSFYGVFLEVLSMRCFLQTHAPSVTIGLVFAANSEFLSIFCTFLYRLGDVSSSAVQYLRTHIELLRSHSRGLVDAFKPFLLLLISDNSSYACAIFTGSFRAIRGSFRITVDFLYLFVSFMLCFKLY